MEVHGRDAKGSLPRPASWVRRTRQKTDCKDDSACSWDKTANTCVDQPTGCGANGSKAKCWKDSELVCSWSVDSNKCVDGVCTGKEKKECKKSPKCSYEKKEGDSTKLCYDAEE
eukprot:TRINITY_DN1097_c0_g1_i1.p1 TRINITY_DN1097_c0_g1~~TRINITY_DN1097_c0_g1_i1.p1  ORF type:complete len:114 (+),score=10.10 TRINITY_DN1097_c0_g1_i1:98-439(+)